MSDLAKILESLLFVASRPLSVKDLAKFSGALEEEVLQTLLQIQTSRQDGGVVLLNANAHWQMATHTDSTEKVRAFLQSDLKEKLTDASLEVLATVAYKQPISRSEIEAIRGVNSQYSIRLLLMRGLIEKIGDSRSSRYQVTTEFLRQMGLQSVSDLPDYEDVMSKVKTPEVPNSVPAAPHEQSEAVATPSEIWPESVADSQNLTPQD